MEITGTITKVYYSSPTFTAGRLRQQGEFTETPFAGHVFVQEGDTVTLQGKFIDHPKYGQQFEALDIVYKADVTQAGLAAWLTRNADGIGFVRARKLVEHFKESFEYKLLTSPEEVAAVAGVVVSKIGKLAEQWRASRDRVALSTRLAAYGLTSYQIVTLLDALGGSVAKILDTDPYLLLRHVPGLGFRTIDQIALKTGIRPNHPGRLRAGLIYALQEAAGDGSTCLSTKELLPMAQKLLALNSLDTAAKLETLLGELIEENKDVKSINTNEVFVALNGLYHIEEFIYDYFSRKSCVNDSVYDIYGMSDNASVNELVNEECPRLDESQRVAIVAALTHRVSVVSGGAGSGKTFVIRSLVNLLESVPKPPSIALCAPTGKAARRLEEILPDHSAFTIHRLLGWSQNKFIHDANNPLYYKVVIVDELSMVDAPLLYHLLQALSDDTVLVLVGDHHQLPPVGPGAVLRDVLQHKLCPATILKVCHRQAGVLKRNCCRVLEGTVSPTEPKPEEDKVGPWYIHDRLQEPSQMLNCVQSLWSEVLPQRFGLDCLIDTQFLTPQHKGPLGTRSLNTLLQRLHQQELGITVAVRDTETQPILYIGDKVINTLNNYTLDVMNGEIGQVLSVNPLVVQFDDKAVEFPSAAKGAVELAYCLTVHKMQGSETKCIVFVCHKSHSYMHHRNLLYTAVTRATKTVIVLGDNWGIRNAASRVVVDERRTLLPLFAHEKAEKLS